MVRTRKTLLRDGITAGDVRPDRKLFGLIISPSSQEEVVEEILNMSEVGRGAQLLATLNVDHVVNLRKNEEFRNAYAWAWKVTIDGAPVAAYSRIAGVEAAGRITGADLFATLTSKWVAGKHRLFFVVSSPEAANRMRTLLTSQGLSEADLRFEVPPFGFENDVELSTKLAERISLFLATHLIISVGAPKSEIWSFRYRKTLGDVKVLCVGAAVEFVVGLKPRAPFWMRHAGLEWLFRFGSEPRRLFQRYFIHSIGFLAAMKADLRSSGRSVV